MQYFKSDPVVFIFKQNQQVQQYCLRNGNSIERYKRQLQTNTKQYNMNYPHYQNHPKNHIDINQIFITTINHNSPILKQMSQLGYSKIHMLQIIQQSLAFSFRAKINEQHKHIITLLFRNIFSHISKTQLACQQNYKYSMLVGKIHLYAITHCCDAQKFIKNFNAVFFNSILRQQIQYILYSLLVLATCGYFSQVGVSHTMFVKQLLFQKFLIKYKVIKVCRYQPQYANLYFFSYGV
eukprot:TRINITY_DN180_c0_g1_i2.p1 TRINITY_DN180_c0_g1~~TRINITY_DN180_c0_g1_i2.p1  ORF type:complete len:237 (-),score=-18.79 TRINITY_DN180_c0_g1_i2:39-749(-)